MRFATRLFAAAFVLTAALGATARAQAPGDPFPSGLIRIYKPVDVRIKITYGDLWMSATIARFDELRGRMEIRYVETLPSSTNPDLSDARVYQILNYAQFFNFNRHKPGFCTIPVKWLAMRDLGDRQLRITLLVIDDLRSPSLGAQGICAAGTYRLPAE